MTIGSITENNNIYALIEDEESSDASTAKQGHMQCGNGNYHLCRINLKASLQSIS